MIDVIVFLLGNLASAIPFRMARRLLARQLLLRPFRGVNMGWTGMCAASLIVLSTLLFGQQEVRQPCPPLPASVLGPQLVAWSDLQKPHPVPELVPPPEPADQSQRSPTQGQQQRQPADQAFTGTIVKDDGQYVLKTSSGTSYQIDDQEKVRLYQGQRVKIGGSLDEKTNVVHVVSLEPLL